MVSDEALTIKSSLEREELDETPITEKREAWEDYALSVEANSSVSSKTLSLSGVPCMLHTPLEYENSRKLIIYIHGGGLVEGSTITSREWCSRLSLAAGQQVISIGYRLAPEHPYPAALDDVFAVYQAVQRHKDFDLISSIGADSTGSLLALQLLIKLRANNIDLPASCFFLSPSIDLTFSGSSMEKNAEIEPLVSKEVLIHYATLYAGTAQLDSPDISPLFADLAGLPPMHVHVDKDELLLDDSVRLEEQINKSGGKVTVEVSSGLWHVWPTWGDFPEARLATQQIVNHINLWS